MRSQINRLHQLDLGDGNARDTQVYYEVPPVIRKAMVELDQIVKSKRDRSHQLEVIKEEMQRLQEETAHRLSYINSLIDEIAP